MAGTHFWHELFFSAHPSGSICFCCVVPITMPVKRKHQGSEISNPVKKRPSSTRPSIQRPAAAGKAASIHAQDPGDPSPIEPIEMPPAANVLQEFIAAAVRKLPNAQKASAKAVMRNGFAMSSACTGSGMAEVVHILMNREFKTNGAVHFSCEKAAHKRLFVHEVVAPFLNFSSHSFGDIASLPKIGSRIASGMNTRVQFQALARRICLCADSAAKTSPS